MQWANAGAQLLQARPIGCGRLRLGSPTELLELSRPSAEPAGPELTAVGRQGGHAGAGVGDLDDHGSVGVGAGVEAGQVHAPPAAGAGSSAARVLC
jgi:hypothetical protein